MKKAKTIEGVNGSRFELLQLHEGKITETDAQKELIAFNLGNELICATGSDRLRFGKNFMMTVRRGSHMTLECPEGTSRLLLLHYEKPSKFCMCRISESGTMCTSCRLSMAQMSSSLLTFVTVTAALSSHFGDSDFNTEKYTELFLILSRCAPADNLKMFLSPAFGGHFRSQVEKVVSEDIRHVSELAHRLGRTELQLNQDFQNAMGITPGEYISRQMFRQICDEMQKGRFTLEEITDSLDFSSSNRIYSLCRSNSGMTPDQLRSEVILGQLVNELNDEGLFAHYSILTPSDEDDELESLI